MLPALSVTPTADAQSSPVDNLLSRLGDNLQTRNEWSTFYLQSQETVSPGEDRDVPEEVPSEIPGVGPIDHPDFRFRLDTLRPTADNRVDTPFGDTPETAGENDRLIVVGDEQTVRLIPPFTGIDSTHQVFAAEVARFDQAPLLDVECPSTSTFDPNTDTCHTITQVRANIFASGLAAAGIELPDTVIGGQRVAPSELELDLFVVGKNGQRIDNIDDAPDCEQDQFCKTPWPRATMTLKRQDADIQASTSTIGTGAVSAYTGTLDFGEEPLELLNGQRLGFDIRAQQGAAVLHLGKKLYPSSINTFGDSARVAVWAEDFRALSSGAAIGDYVSDNFASAANLPPAQRHVVVKSVHYNVWGNDEGNCPNVSNPAQARNFQCPFDNIDQTQHRLRILRIDQTSRGLFDGTPIVLDPLGEGGVEASREARCCNAVGGPIKYTREFRSGFPSDDLAVYTYDFAYPSDFKDGTYEIQIFQPTSHLNPWVVGHRFNVATLDFKVSAAPGEVLTHKALAGEATDYVFRLVNNGTIADQVSMTVRPGPAGWKAELSESSIQMDANSQRDVRLRVTPPETAKPGDKAVHTVSVVSGTNSLETITVTTNVVDPVEAVPGVKLSTSKSVVPVRPGDTNAVPITVRNTGLRADTFVTTVSAHGTSAGNNCGSWGLGLERATNEISSQSRVDFIVKVTPPSNTPASMTCVLTAKAQGLDFGGVSQALLIPMQITVVTDMALGLFDTTDRQLRGAGADRCESDFNVGFRPADCSIDSDSDTRYDTSTIARIELRNAGDLRDNITLQAAWLRGSGVEYGACEPGEGSGRDGVPDGWRFQFPPTGIMPDNPQPGVRTLKTVTVEPGKTSYQFLELGYLTGNVCGGSGTPAGNQATMRVTARSANDPTVTRTMDIPVSVVGKGDSYDNNLDRYPQARYGVSIEMGNGQKSLKSTSIDDLDPAEYRLRVANTGNERSQVTVSLQPASEGWTHAMRVVDRVPSGVSCSADDSSNRRFTCDLGSYDEAVFGVTLTPPAEGAAIGDTHGATVTATTQGASGTVVSSQQLTARIIGSFDYVSTLHATAIHLNAGQNTPARVPFTIHNTGTEDDTYLIIVPTAPLGWSATPSLRSIEVPSGEVYHGFVEVTAPEADKTGDFQLQIQSEKSGAAKFHGFRATSHAAHQNFEFTGDNGGDQLIKRGEVTRVKVTVTDKAAAAANSVNLSVDSLSALPPGWKISPARYDNVAIGANGIVTREFNITAPENVLGVSRVPFHLKAQAGQRQAWTDVTVSLASSFGVGLKVVDETFTPTIGRAGTNTFQLEVKNRGLSADTVIFCENTIPKECKHFFSGPRALQGWRIDYNPERIALGPQETAIVEATIRAPRTYNVNPGEVVTAFIFAESQGDPTRGGSVELQLVSAQHKLDAKPLSPTVWVEPESRATQTIVLNNTGSLILPRMTLKPVLTGQSTLDIKNLNVELSHKDITLEPGEALEVSMSFDVPVDPQPIPQFNKRFNIRLDIGSLDTNFNQSLPELGLGPIMTETRVMPHVAFDADDDFVREYAVDRNQDPKDGFEYFLESNPDEGIASKCISCPGTGEPPLATFLTSEAREAKTVTITQANRTVKVLNYPMDPDDDGETELILDSDGDGLPDIYWDPASTPGDATQVWQRLGTGRVGGGALLNLPKDVTGDGILDYLIDLDLNNVLSADGIFTFQTGTLDVVFDVTQGEFTELVHVDFDGNGVTDYVVDRNGNGKADTGEPVIFAADGRIRTVQLIDVDGDGEPDQVYTTTDRGPNYFLRDASGRSISIVLRDVTGDGVMDWTYDMDGDGIEESYYDPVEGKTGVVPQQNTLAEVAKDYWYVLLLLITVTALFVVLIGVTRR